MLVRAYLNRLVERNRTLILEEAASLRDFSSLLMKHRNTGVAWTREEKQRLRNDLAQLSLVVPALAIFLLPGGALLLPVLAEALDRRKHKRTVTLEPEVFKQLHEHAVGDPHPVPGEPEPAPVLNKQPLGDQIS